MHYGLGRTLDLDLPCWVYGPGAAECRLPRSAPRPNRLPPARHSATSPRATGLKSPEPGGRKSQAEAERSRLGFDSVIGRREPCAGVADRRPHGFCPQRRQGREAPPLLAGFSDGSDGQSEGVDARPPDACGACP